MAQTILVIDDEPALRCLAEALLDDLGYSVLLTESGQAALRLLHGRPHKADAVLLDMTMPGLSPEDTLHGLREINPALPVIILSAHSQETVQGRFEKASINGYLQKPYSDWDLKATLLRALPPSASASASIPSSSAGTSLNKVLTLTQEEKRLLAQEFLATRRLELPHISDLLRAADFDRLRIVGHTLKGSAGCFGFQQLTALGATLEHSAEERDAVGCHQQIGLLEDFLAHTVVAA